MLGMRTYPKKYIAACRAKIEADLSAYRAANAKTLETTFFNNMVIVLDHLFVHRLRTVEGKDGNPLNEIRLLSDSLMSNNGKLTMDKTIKYDPAQSVLKYASGNGIQLTETQFLQLSKAFFAEIESKFQ